MDDVKPDQRPSNVDSPAQPPVAAKRLYRSRDNRVLKGVAGGIGEYFGFDPVIVRLALLLTFAMGGIGFVAYIIGAVLIPSRPKGETAPATPAVNGLEVLHNRSLGVWVLVAIGVALLLDRLDLNIVGDRLWPLLLIGGGLIVLMRRRDASAAAPGSATKRTDSSFDTSPLFEHGPTRRDLQAEALAELHDPIVDEVDRAVAAMRAERLGDSATETPVPPVVRRPRRRRSALRRLLFATLGFFLVLFLLTAAVGFRLLSRGVGEQVWTPTIGVNSPGKFGYTFGAGNTTLDLSSLSTALTGGQTNRVGGTVNVDFGRVNVIIPTGPGCPAVNLKSKARIALGYSGDGESTGVVGGSRSSRFNEATTRVDSSEKNVIDLTVSLVAGNVNIQKIPNSCTAPATA